MNERITMKIILFVLPICIRRIIISLNKQSNWNTRRNFLQWKMKKANERSTKHNHQLHKIWCACLKLDKSTLDICKYREGMNKRDSVYFSKKKKIIIDKFLMSFFRETCMDIEFIMLCHATSFRIFFKTFFFICNISFT